MLFPEDSVGVDGGGTTVIGIAVAVDEVGVCNVDCGFVGGEAEAVWAAETVGYDAYIAGGGIKAVYELRKLGFWPEALFVAVNGICEPD